MNAAPAPAQARTHWTNYEVTYLYADEVVPDAVRIKVIEGRETLADLPRLIAARNRKFHPDADQIAVLRIEVTADTRTPGPLHAWLDEIARATTIPALREISFQAQLAHLIGPRARRRAASLLTRHLREREAKITARAPRSAA
jgi:hypothetical protein